MSKSDKGPKSIKDDIRAEHPVYVQLSKKLDRRQSPLIGVIDVLFKASTNILQSLVNNRDRKGRAVTLQVVC